MIPSHYILKAEDKAVSDLYAHVPVWKCCSVSAGCTELVAALPPCYIKLWECGEAGAGSPIDSHKNGSGRDRNVETEIPRKQQALGGFPNGLCVERVVHRMALLGGMEP